MMQTIYRFSFTKLSRIQDARRGAKKKKKCQDALQICTLWYCQNGHYDEIIERKRAKWNMSQVQERVKYCSKNSQIIKVLTVERVYHSSRLEKKKQ